MDRFFPKLIFFVFFLFSVQLHGDKSSKIETTYEQVVLPILENTATGATEMERIGDMCL